MNHRRWAAVTAVFVFLGVLAVIAVQFFAPPREAALGGYTGHRASPSAVASGSAAPSGAPGSPAARDVGAGARPSGTAVPSGRPTWNPPGETARPKVPGGEGAKPYRLPSVTPPKPALTRVPPAAHARGRLAAGFPDHAMPVQRGAAVASSSVAPQGRRVLVGLELRSDDSPEAVLEFYADHCGDLGWPVTHGSAPDGAARLLCSLGRDSLVVTVRPVPTGTTVVTATGAFEVR